MISNPSKSQAIRTCPACGSSKVTRSQRIDIVDRALSLLNIYPYRCKQHICNHRFTSTGRE